MLVSPSAAVLLGTTIIFFVCLRRKKHTQHTYTHPSKRTGTRPHRQHYRQQNYAALCNRCRGGEGGLPFAVRGPCRSLAEGPPFPSPRCTWSPPDQSEPANEGGGGYGHPAFNLRDPDSRVPAKWVSRRRGGSGRSKTRNGSYESSRFSPHASGATFFCD